MIAVTNFLRVGDRRLSLGGAAGRSLKHDCMDFLIRRALVDGRVSRGGRVAEVSAGTAGVALAEVAAGWGLRARVYVPAFVPVEMVERMRAAGAEVVVTEATMAALRSSMEDLMAAERDGSLCWLRQNYAVGSGAAYAAMALEAGVRGGVVVGGVGSGASLRGFADALEARRVVAVFSPDIGGLRDVGQSMDIGDGRDQGALEALRERFGDALVAVRVTRDELGPAHEALRRHGVRAGDSTAAAWKVLSEYGGEGMAISVDGVLA